MTRFIVSIIGGLSLGGVYALISLGVVLAYRATGTFNFAHGQLMTISGLLVGVWTASLPVPAPVAVLLAALVPTFVAGIFYLVVLRRMTGAPHFLGIIATLGLASILDGAILLRFSGKESHFHFPGMPTGASKILGVGVANDAIALMIASLLIAGLTIMFIRTTHTGRILQAAGQDALLAAQSGVDVNWVQLLSWMIAGFLSGLAGIGFASTHPVDASMAAIALAAFPAILVGGIDSVTGALVGGLFIGLFQAFVTTYYGNEFLDVTTYGLLLVVLLIRPQGLFGTERVSRV